MAGTTIDTLKINVETDANDAIASIDKLSASLLKLGKSGGSSTSGYKAVANGITNIGRSAKRNMSHVNNFAGAVKRLALQYLSFTALVRGAKASIDLSSGLTEQENVVYTVFGRYTEQLDDLLEKCNTALGMSRLTTMKVASNFQQLGVSMRMPQEEAAKMSTELTTLAANMTSMFNLSSVEDAMTALRSIYTGQSRPMRQFGVDLTEANLSAWALSRGLKANFDSMTQAEKATLRYQYTLETLGYTAKDFEKTANTWANSTRTLIELFKEFGTTVGTVLIGAFKPLVTALRDVMQKVVNFAKIIADALGAIFGWTIEISTAATGDGADFGGYESGLEGVAASAGDAGDAVSGVSDKVKELKRTLLGFDEANVLNDISDSAGGSGGSGSGSGGAGLSSPDGLNYSIVHADNITKYFESEIKSLEELGATISAALTKAMDGIKWDDIYQKARNFGTGLAQFLNGLITPELFGSLGRTIAKAINTKLWASFEFAHIFDWSNLGESLKTGLVEFLGSIDWYLALQNATNWASGIADALNAFIEEGDSFEEVAKFVGEAIKTALAGADKFLTDVNWYNVGYAIRTGLRTFFSGFKIDSVGRLIWKAINAAIETAKGVFSGDKAAESVITALTTAFTGIKDALVSFINEVDLTTLTSNFGKLVEALAPVTEGFGEGIAMFFQGLAKIGAVTLNLIAVAIGKIADAISKLDPDLLQSIGYSLALLSGSLFLMRGVTKVAEGVTRLKDALFGVSTAASAASSGIGGMAGAAGTASSAMSTNLLTTVGNVTASIAGETGLIAAIVVLSKKLEEFVDLAKGGNGILTDFGGGLDSVFSILSRGSQITSDEKDALFGVKEAMEDGTATVSDIAQALIEAGVNSEMFSAAVEEVKGSMNTTDEELEVFDKILQLLPEHIEEPAGLLAEFAENSEETAKQIGAAFTDIQDMQLTTGFAEDVQQINILKGIFEETFGAGGDVQSALLAAVEYINNFSSDADSDLAALEETIDARLGAGTFDALIGSTEKAEEKIAGLGDTTSSFTTGSLADLASSALKSVGLAILGKSAEATDKKIGSLSESTDSVAETVPTTMSELADEVDKNFEAIGDSAKGAGDAVTKGFAENALHSITGFVNSLTDGGQDAYNAASEFGQRVIEGYKDKLGIASPSKVMKEQGEFTIAGLIDGVNSKKRDASNAMESIVTAMKNAFNGLKGQMYDIGRDAAQAVANGISSIYIRTPHLWWYSTAWMNGDTSYWETNSGVNWYAKGGLFEGASVIGVGEAGKEAVLPLENQRTMQTLADAITNKMGGKDLQTAVYNGVMLAMSSQNRSTNVNVTLEGDANSIFRVVQDKSRDYKRVTGVNAF